MEFIQRVWLATLLLLMITPLILKANALEPYIRLYPSQGSVLDTVRLEYRAEFNAYEGIWIYYDDLCIASGLSQTFGAPPIYGLDYDFSPPNRHPYSDLGIHNITLKAWTGDPIPQQVLVMNATFEIIEYVPCDDYLALNATYYDLLANYTKLVGDYNSLLANYSALLANHNTLLDEHNSLLSNYNSLSANYSGLLDTFNQLEFNYDNLRGSYNGLNANYYSLQTNYNALVGEIATTRNTGYLFAVTTLILIATTVYLAVRRPKLKSETK